MEKKKYSNDIHSCTLYKLVRITGSGTRSYADELESTLFCDDPDSFDDVIFMTPHMYKEIWGKTWSESSFEEKLMPIVKISYNGNSIYRRYRACSAKGFEKYQVAMTRRSIDLLCSTDDILGLDRIDISKGDKETFFKYHPDHSVRKTYEMTYAANQLTAEANKLSKQADKSSKWSLFLGCASFILAIVSLLKSFGWI